MGKHLVHPIDHNDRNQEQGLNNKVSSWSLGAYHQTRRHYFVIVVIAVIIIIKCNISYNKIIR